MNLLPIALLVPLLTGVPAAYAEDGEATSDTQKELEELRARLRAVEQQQDQDRAAAAEEEDQTVPLDLETHLQGFGAVQLASEDGGPVGFYLDELVFRYTANLDRKYGFVGELAFEPGNEGLVVDLEALELNLAFFPAFGVRVGRTHAPWTYWANTALHGAYRFLPVKVPMVMEVEDRGGGVMPIHQTGLWFAGAVPAGLWRVNYQVGSSNGRSAYIGQVQQSGDTGWGKAVNGHVWLESPGGILFGVGAHHDVIEPWEEADAGLVSVPETLQEDVVGAQINYTGAAVEFETEGYMIAQSQPGEDAHLSYGAYGLFGYRVGKTTPFLFGDAILIDQESPYYALTNELSSELRGAAGVRYSLGLRVVVKAQGEVVHKAGLGDAADVLTYGGHLQLAAGF